MTILESAIQYTRKGWRVVPIQAGSKRPEGRTWQNTRLDEHELATHFSGNENLGVLLGAPSNGLIDIDLDAVQAGHLAPRFLPPTPAVFGRASKEESHWLYVVSEIPSTIQHETPAPEGAMIVELRSTGGQTVFPPSIHPTGEDYEWNSQGEPAAVEIDVLITAVGRLAAASLLARAWPERGARNKASLALSGGLLRAGWDEDAVKDFVIAVAEAGGDEEAADRTLSITATKDKLDQGSTEVTGWPALAGMIGIATPKGMVPGKDIIAKAQKWLGLLKPAEIGSGMDLTDLGNARRLASMFGGELKHSSKIGWLAWDEKRWREDHGNVSIHQRAEQVIDDIQREAGTKSGEEQKAHFKWAKTSQSAGHLNALVDIARYQDRISVPPESSFDRQPLLVNCQNGTLDLDTMELRPHRREDRLTKIIAADYDPDAKSAMWERFLNETTEANPEMLEFLQQAAGYSITGLTDEEKLFFVHGPTASGKSTFVEALKATLGDYAATTDFETFLAKKNDGGTRNDIARLAWVRMVSSIEVEQGKKIAEGLVKTLTGGDVVTARFLYKELFEFKPQFKLWLVANHKPRVDNESAIWRRILIVPFDRSVPEDKRDPRVKRELITASESGAAIFAWAVAGYQKWKAAGALPIPKVVSVATDAYREEMDPLKDFLEQAITFDPADKTLMAPKSDVRERYVEWCRRGGSFPMNERDFKSRLLDLDVTEKRGTAGQQLWLGISLMKSMPKEGAEF